MSASSIRNVSEGDFPADGPPRQKLGHALKYAMLAPTETNWPPWEFRLTDAHIELVARKEPDGRELMISCGGALQYLKLALKHFGCLGRVELFPDLDQPALAARIYFGFGRERDAQDRLLFEAMNRPLAHFPSAGETPFSETTLAALTHAVAGERGWVEFAQSEIIRKRLMEFASVSERRWMGADGLRELATSQARHPEAAARSEGPDVTASGWRVARWTRPLLAFTVRRNDSANMATPPGPQPAFATATLAVVKTKTDDKHGWLAAGHAMARVILQAQALGVSWSFFNQAVRRRDAREALRTGIGHKGFAQVILRFGLLMADEGARPTFPQTVTATSI